VRYLFPIFLLLISTSVWAEMWGEVESLGNSVNSYLDEGDPAIYNGVLYFSARDRVGGLGDWDIYYVDMENIALWTMAEPVPQINSAYLDASPCFDEQNDTIFFHSDRPDGMGKEDIYYSQRVNGKWQKPKNLGPPVNTPNVEAAPCLSEDGKMLFFCSDREGGLGGLDIWVSLRTDKGWSEPLNLGSRVNTSSNEKYPFFSHNLLIWSSNVLLQTGDYDLFCSHLTSEGWEKATRLPDFINSDSPEWGAFYDTEDGILYFTAIRPEGLGGYDIFKVSWEVSTSPESFDRVQALLYRY
jgi:hypothetical protein